MKIKFLKDYKNAGTLFKKGKVVNVSKKSGESLVKKGIAKFVEETKESKTSKESVKQDKKKHEVTREDADELNKGLDKLASKKSDKTKKPIVTAAEQKLIREHYRNPRVKEVIIDHAIEGKLWRAFNGGFVDWYRYIEDRARLFGPMTPPFGPTTPDDYDYLTAHHQSLYWTLNYLGEKTWGVTIPRSLHDINGNKLTIGTFADTITYSLGVDIDSGKGYNIMQADVREAVESLAQFMCDRFRGTCPTSTYANFSGGGIYIYIHHGLFTKNFLYESSAETSWRILVDCFNTYIKDIESQFFEQHPEYKGKAKADAINNQKRVFKTILSVHKSYPFACIPINVKNVKIDIKKARLPISDKTINECKTWMKEFDVKERIPLLLELKKYENRCKPFIDDTPHRIKILTEKADEEYWPPCMKKIITLENVPNGATRMKTLYTTFIGPVGYGKEEAEKGFKEVSNRLGGPETNIFESWFCKMSCPTCKTIQKKGGGFPHMNMGELGICQPDETCRGITNPVEYAEKKSVTKTIPVMNNGKQIATLQLMNKNKFSITGNDGEIIVRPTDSKTPWYSSPRAQGRIIKALTKKCKIVESEAEDVVDILCTKADKKVPELERLGAFSHGLPLDDEKQEIIDSIKKVSVVRSIGGNIYNLHLNGEIIKLKDTELYDGPHPFCVQYLNRFLDKVVISQDDWDEKFIPHLLSEEILETEDERIESEFDVVCRKFIQSIKGKPLHNWEDIKKRTAYGTALFLDTETNILLICSDLVQDFFERFNIPITYKIKTQEFNSFLRIEKELLVKERRSVEIPTGSNTWKSFWRFDAGKLGISEEDITKEETLEQNTTDKNMPKIDEFEGKAESEKLDSTSKNDAIPPNVSKNEFKMMSWDQRLQQIEKFFDTATKSDPFKHGDADFEDFEDFIFSLGILSAIDFSNLLSQRRFTDCSRDGSRIWLNSSFMEQDDLICELEKMESIDGFWEDEEKELDKPFFTEEEEIIIRQIIDENKEENYIPLTNKFSVDRIGEGIELGIFKEILVGKKLEFVGGNNE